MHLAADHPLRAEMLEREAWINVDRWQMRRAIQDFEKAARIREANQKQGNTFAWRPILLNRQGHAMALHFLGQDKTETDKEGDIIRAGSIGVYESLIHTIHNPPRDLPFGEAEDRNARLPNIYERLGDAHLFGPSSDPSQAEDSFRKAINHAMSQGFDKSATMWFHLTRLRYKHCLALALDGNLKTAAEVQTEAKQLEDQFAVQMGNPEAFAKQQAAYSLEKQVALAILELQSAAAEQTAAGLQSLEKVIHGTDQSGVKRGNIEVLLLVFQQIFARHQMFKSQEDVDRLGLKLSSFLEPLKNGDSAIRTVYLSPVIDLARAAIQDTDVLEQLSDAISTGTLANQ